MVRGAGGSLHPGPRGGSRSVEPAAREAGPWQSRACGHSNEYEHEQTLPGGVGVQHEWARDSSWAGRSFCCLSAPNTGLHLIVCVPPADSDAPTHSARGVARARASPGARMGAGGRAGRAHRWQGRATTCWPCRGAGGCSIELVNHLPVSRVGF